MAIGRRFLEILRDAAVALGVDIAFKEFTKNGLKKAGEKAGEHLGKQFEDKRAELLEEFRLLDQDGHPLPNLWRRHRASIIRLEENGFIQLLCKICKDPQEGRRPTLLWLEGVSDEKFEQVLYLLDHDVFLQWAAKFQRGARRIAKKDWEEFGTLFHTGAATSKEVVRKTIYDMDDAARRAARPLNELARWLESLK